MKPAYIITLIMFLAAPPAQAVDCRDVNTARQEFRRINENINREIRELEREKESAEHELAMIDGDSARTLTKLQEELNRKEAEYEQSINVHRLMVGEHNKQIEELKNGLYCSKCDRSKSQIEKSGRESFAEHVRNVKGRQMSASSEVLKKLREEHKREWETSFKKSLQLDTESRKIAEKMTAEEKNAENRKKSLSTRIADIRSGINRKSQEATNKIRDLDSRMRSDVCN